MVRSVTQAQFQNATHLALVAFWAILLPFDEAKTM